jgi:hypothetical protein
MNIKRQGALEDILETGHHKANDEICCQYHLLIRLKFEDPWAGGVAQVISKHGALSSNPSAGKKKTNLKKN